MGSGHCTGSCDPALGSSLSPDGCLPGIAEQGPREPAGVEGQQKTPQLALCFHPHARRGCLAEQDTLRKKRSRAPVDSGDQRLFEKRKGRESPPSGGGGIADAQVSISISKVLSLSLFSRLFNLISMVEVQFTFNKIHPF